MTVRSKFWVSFDLFIGSLFLAILLANTVLTWATSPDRCPVVARQKAGPEPCRWESQSLTYRDGFAFPGMTPEATSAARSLAYDAIQKACGMRFSPAPDGQPANLTASVGPMPKDYPTAIGLASVACNDVPHATEWQLYSDKGSFNDKVAYLVSLHEIGHNLGLDHDDDALSMMKPILDNSIAGPGPTDIANLQLRYGKPGEPLPSFDPPKPPDPAPAPNPPAPIPPTPVPPTPNPTPTPEPPPMPKPPTPAPTPPEPTVTTFDLPLGTQHSVAFQRAGDAMVAKFFIPAGGYRTVIIRTFGSSDVKLSLASKTRVLTKNQHGAPDGRNAKIEWKLPQGQYTARVECLGNPGRTVVTAFISQPAR